MPDQTLKELDRAVRRALRGETGFTVDQICEAVSEILIDEASLAVCFDVHKAAKTGAMEAEGLEDGAGEFQIVETAGLDVLGQPEVMKRPPDAKCPVCSRSIACTRFAPHLEKCVGLGRNSSRIASKRIASNQREAAGYGISEDEDEEEWTGDRKKKKRDKLSPRRSRMGRKNGGGCGDKDSDTRSVPSNPSSAPSTPEQAIQFEQLTEDERKALFSQVCGVISEQTRHMCTRSVRCQQHSDTQRRTVRTALFGTGCSALAARPGEPLEDGALKDSLNKLLEKASRASSPADSTSTVASAGSTKKKSKGKKGKGRKVKVHVSQPSSV